MFGFTLHQYIIGGLISFIILQAALQVVVTACLRLGYCG
jgi:hypothetical protein